MFTTGSKLFIAATSLAIAAAIVFGVTNTGDVGWTATVGLVGAAVALTLLTGVNFFVRDSNVGSMQPDATTNSPAAHDAPGSSMWPLIGAVGVTLIAIGIVATPVVFKAGVVVVLATVVEWMVQGWSERASSDRAFNAGVRKRILNPLEFPVLGAVGLAVVVYSFSRIMLFLSKAAGPAAFAVIAALLLVGGFLFASQPSVKRSIVVGICTIAGLGLVSAGAVMAIDGQRQIHAHDIIEADPAVCASNAEAEVDEKGSQSLAAKSNVAATLYFENGRLSAQVIGIPGRVTTITLPRSTPSNIVFRNLDAEPVRLTANLGTFETDVEVNGEFIKQSPLTCTTLVEQDGRQFLTITFAKASSGSLAPYSLVVPGVDGAVVEVVVP
ncbi:MAG: hypothetical protein AAB131_22710 [Actinomycetota bacterium]